MWLSKHCKISALALVLWGASGCTEKADPPFGIAAAGGASGAAGSFGVMTGGTGAVGAGAGGMTAAGTSGGMTAAGGSGGTTQAGVGGVAPPPDAGAAGAAGSATDGGDLDAMIPAEIPDPVTEPYVWGFGIGVTDMPSAVDFYKTVMQLTVEKEVDRGDRTETILYATTAERGARLILMKFNDNRTTEKITAKLVWQASNSRAVNQAAAMHPDYVSRISFPVYQFDGPETYIQEVAGIFDTEGGDIDVPYLVAMGFSVSDLTASRTFYREGLGMTEESVGTFPVTDATGSGTIVEYSERHPAGAGIVLQSWSPMRNSKDNPVKIVLFVQDAQANADAVVASGGTLVEPAARSAVYDNRLLIVTKDRDGYLLELVQ
jgi:predicted enzyme related to lactoylglutathione lyase